MSPKFSCLISTRYPELIRIYAERLRSVLPRNWDANFTFQVKVSTYFSGSLPHCKDIITSTLLTFLDIPICDISADDQSPILRVSQPWPDGTKGALRTSLDNGIFDDWKSSIYCGPVWAVHTMHFPLTLVDDTNRIESTRLFHASKFSLLTSVKGLYIHSRPFHVD